MNLANKQNRAPVWLMLTGIGLGLATFVTFVPAFATGFPGPILIVIGSCYILTHRPFGRHYYGLLVRKDSSHVWERVGVRGVQVLLLGIGVLMALAGIALMIRAYLNHVPIS